MTKVYYEQDGDRHILSARGHATGSEQVCAAISAIVGALAGWMENADRDPEVCISVLHCDLDMGRVLLEAKGDVTVHTAFELAVIGLLQVEARHPDYLRVEEGPLELPCSL